MTVGIQWQIVGGADERVVQPVDAARGLQDVALDEILLPVRGIAYQACIAQNGVAVGADLAVPES